MFNVSGKHSTIKVFSDNIEEGALKQINNIASEKYTEGERVRIMPDAHRGKGSVIGFTSTTRNNRYNPNVIGVDIGCGVLVYKLGNIDIDLEHIKNYIEENVPVGRNIYDEPVADFSKDKYSEIYDFINEFYTNLSRNPKYYLSSIGTLGGGNHFIEIDEDDKGNKFLLVHSGSRKLGYDVAKYFADKMKNEYNQEYYKRRNEIINRCKAYGREEKIESELYNLKQNYTKKNYLIGERGQKYLNAMQIVNKYSRLNRRMIANRIVKGLKNVDGRSTFKIIESIHNYVDEEGMIRKGAVSAKEDERVVIALNMSEGAILGTGKGNKDWNYSAPHGAGRTMSRREAKETIDEDKFKKQMEGIEYAKLPLDEAPNAYKDTNEIKYNIKETISIDKLITPIFNFKA